jgi:hypothetical protein
MKYIYIDSTHTKENVSPYHHMTCYPHHGVRQNSIEPKYSRPKLVRVRISFFIILSNLHSVADAFLLFDCKNYFLIQSTIENVPFSTEKETYYHLKIICCFNHDIITSFNISPPHYIGFHLISGFSLNITK